ncbi:MAG TPA: hypothetical protein VJL59_23055, partial [Anaerolineales bacterium]|nr:hypothetical protein [Anaerolineales bacterium]
LLGELSFDVDYVVPPSQAQTDAYTLTTALPFAFVGGTFSKALLSTSTTYLYQLVDKTTGQHLKFGISSTPRTRYSQVFMSDKTMRIISSGSRAEMLASERWLVERLPGRLNLEPWAGARYGQFQLFPGFDR